jgi:hypothetical protein
MRSRFFALLAVLCLTACATGNFEAIKQEIIIPDKKAVVMTRIQGGQSITWTRFDEFKKPTTRSLTMGANEGLAAYVIPAGHYIITNISILPEWQANAGLHKITHKPYYSEFTVEEGEAIYLGDITLGTDGSFYKNNNQGDGSPLALVLTVAINAASKSFGDKDVHLTVVDNFAEAQTTLKKEVPTFNRSLQKRLLKMGYWAGKDSEE